MKLMIVGAAAVLVLGASLVLAQDSSDFTYVGPCGGSVTQANGTQVSCPAEYRVVCFSDGTCGCDFDYEYDSICKQD